MLPYGQELPRVISRQRSLGASVLTGVVWDDNAFIAWGTQGFFSRLLVPRSVRRAMHPGTTVPVCYVASSFLPSAGYGARAVALSRAW